MRAHIPTARSLRRAFWSCAASVLLISCGSDLRRARVGSHPVNGSEPEVVDFPPPPAEVEELPQDPGPPCVWVDGRWEYVGRRWEWREGAYVQAPSSCYYAPPVMVWLPSETGGELYYLSGHWYTDDGANCQEPTACRVRESNDG